MEGSEPWTAGRVRARLVKAFSALPRVGIYSPQFGVLVSASPGKKLSDIEFIAFTAQHLEERDRAMLLTWARVKSERKTARATSNELSTILKEMGWPKTTFYRRVTAATINVARAIALRGAVDAALKSRFGLSATPAALDGFIADVGPVLRAAA
jgi:hypothetical protein